MYCGFQVPGMVVYQAIIWYNNHDKKTVMTLRRMAAGMRESGENPGHLTGAVSAAGRHSGRKSVIEGNPLRRRMDGRFYQPCEPEDL